MKTITRKTMLYKTGVEYGDYTMNHVLGCTHGCKFPCYAYMMKKRFKEIAGYEDWLEPRLVSNTLELLDKEIPRLKKRIQSVELCFTTDPFMCGYPEVTEMSVSAIRKLNAAGIKCSVLTKGILPIELAELSKDNEYGITLVSLNEAFRIKFEPGASYYVDRIKALEALHAAGCKTWISIEPYPTPNLVNQNIKDILDSIEFANKIIFGRTNYNKDVTSYVKHRNFYNEQAQIVIDFCTKNEKIYHIKEGTITS